MTDPRYYAAIRATWPAQHETNDGPWLHRDGAGGGKRASATTAQGSPVSEHDIDRAEARAKAAGQPALFMLRPEDAALDGKLAKRGYDIFDRTLILSVPMAKVADLVPQPVTAFAIWPPLEVIREIWSECGIGAARQAVIDRAAGPKAAILGRSKDQPAGAAYVALHDGIAMVHAVCVTPRLQKLGTARNMMHEAASWANQQGAQWFSALVTEANAPARALYASLGMEVVGRYHYRLKADT